MNRYGQKEGKGTTFAQDSEREAHWVKNDCLSPQNSTATIKKRRRRDRRLYFGPFIVKRRPTHHQGLLKPNVIQLIVPANGPEANPSSKHQVSAENCSRRFRFYSNRFLFYSYSLTTCGATLSLLPLSYVVGH